MLDIKPNHTLAALIGAMALTVGVPAFAQNAASTPSASSTSAPMAKARSPQSLECSKEADAKGLHGKAREKFRRACKKGGASKGSGGTGKQDID